MSESSDADPNAHIWESLRNKSTSQIYEVLRTLWGLYWAESDPVRKASFRVEIIARTRIVFRPEPEFDPESDPDSLVRQMREAMGTPGPPPGLRPSYGKGSAGWRRG